MSSHDLTLYRLRPLLQDINHKGIRLHRNRDMYHSKAIPLKDTMQGQEQPHAGAEVRG